MPTKLDPIAAAESVGVSTYDFDNIVREQAAGRLESLAHRIRHGNESNEGDVEHDDFARIVAEVWNQVESAKVLTAAWLAEEDGEDSDPGA